MPTFLSGGFLPMQVRGKSFSQLIHLVDWGSARLGVHRVQSRIEG